MATPPISSVILCMIAWPTLFVQPNVGPRNLLRVKMEASPAAIAA